MDCSLPDFSVHGIFQARVLEWVAISFSRGFSQPWDWTRVIMGYFNKTKMVQPVLSLPFPLLRWTCFPPPYLIIPMCMCSVAQLCLTFCDPMDYSLPDSSIHEIFQARILEWVAISFSRGSSWPRDWTHISSIAGVFFMAELPLGSQFVPNTEWGTYLH